MLAAALLELVPDPDAFVSKLNASGIPGVEFHAEKTVKCGIQGTQLVVSVHGKEEGRDVHDDHDHGHHHSSFSDIRALVDVLEGLEENVRNDVINVYSLLAKAESHVHGVPVDQIHFHEVGNLDAVADITAVCMLIDELGPDRVIVSPVRTGYGTVKCAHGTLPVPAPATAYLLKDVPVYAGNTEGELCTPTGAALLKYFADGYGEMPPMKLISTGYGMGKKDFGAANCVRAFFGSAHDITASASELACNVDDMTAEEISFAMERLFEGGAMDVFTVPAGMKKSRPGTMIHVVCLPGDTDKMIRLLFKYTTTIGVREYLTKRYVLARKTETLDTKFGAVRVKRSSGYGTERSKYEYEDLAAIARSEGISIFEVRKELEKEE